MTTTNKEQAKTLLGIVAVVTIPALIIAMLFVAFIQAAAKDAGLCDTREIECFIRGGIK